MYRAVFLKTWPSMSQRSLKVKIYALPWIKRRALSALEIFSPVYWIMSVPCVISWAAKSPWPAMREGPTRTCIFTAASPFHTVCVASAFLGRCVVHARTYTYHSALHQTTHDAPASWSICEEGHIAPHSRTVLHVEAHAAHGRHVGPCGPQSHQ